MVCNMPVKRPRKTIRLQRALSDKKLWLIYWGLIAVLIVFRLYCGMICGNQYYSSQAFDDKLMFDYAQLRTHFHSFDYLSLVKTMSYPLFIAACYIFHVNYTLALSVVWCVAALIFGWLLWRLFRSRLISFFFFAYTLFLPSAFDYYIGGRMYRNSIIAPFTIMTFSLIFWSIYYAMKGRNDSSKIKTILVSILAGCVFTYTYYIKEDGIWILASLGFFTLVAAVVLLVRLFKRKVILKKAVTRIFLLFLPFLIFVIGTEGYKQINYHYFGVREIQTRTEGEPGRFVKNLYCMDAKGRSNYIWTPEDAIAQAIEVSPTLQSRQDLINNLYVNPWALDLKKDPYYGDLLTWGLRYAMTQSGLYKSEQQAADFLSKVNNEIEAAYSDGRLKKSNRFQILSSAGGFSREELPELLHLSKRIFRSALFLEGYSPNNVKGDVDDPVAQAAAIRLTHISYLNDYSNRTMVNMTKVSKLCNVIFGIYRVINPILLSLSLIIFVWLLVRAINLTVHKQGWEKSKREYFCAGMIFVLMGIAIAYTLAISWFSDFIFRNGIIQQVLNFYSIGLPAIFSVLYGFSLGSIQLLLRNIDKSTHK